jgi:hypothetical protein
MSDAVTTVANAPNNPTPAGAMTPADGSPARTGVIPDNAYERLADADRSKYSRVRAGPEGGSEWRLREIVERESAAATKQRDGSAGDPTAAKPGETSPALVPGEKYKFGDLELTGQEISDLLKHKGETDLRRAAVPADPAAYKVELPKDLVLPAGTDWQFNQADPALAAARAWSHANGLTQDQFSSLLGQYASMEATKSDLPECDEKGARCARRERNAAGNCAGNLAQWRGRRRYCEAHEAGHVFGEDRRRPRNDRQEICDAGSRLVHATRASAGNGREWWSAEPPQ